MTDITIDDLVAYDILRKKRESEFVEERPRLYINIEDIHREGHKRYQEEQRRERESEDSGNNGYIEIQM